MGVSPMYSVVIVTSKQAVRPAEGGRGTGWLQRSSDLCTCEEIFCRLCSDHVNLKGARWVKFLNLYSV